MHYSSRSVATGAGPGSQGGTKTCEGGGSGEDGRGIGIVPLEPVEARAGWLHGPGERWPTAGLLVVRGPCKGGLQGHLSGLSRCSPQGVGCSEDLQGFAPWSWSCSQVPGSVAASFGHEKRK